MYGNSLSIVDTPLVSYRLEVSAHSTTMTFAKCMSADAAGTQTECASTSIEEAAVDKLNDAYVCLQLA